MAPSENIGCGSCKNRFDKDFNLTATDKTGFQIRGIGQVEQQSSRLFFEHHLTSSFPDIVFHTAASHSPDRRSIISNQYLSGFKTGNRPADLNDGCQCSPSSL